MSYLYPPSDPVAAEEWPCDNPYSAAAYSAGWTADGQGYGLVEANEQWPECPGFDWEDGVPEWSEIKQSSDYEYRTVLCIGQEPPEVNGWEMIYHCQINPEPALYDEKGNDTGVMYIGEDNMMVVYKRKQDETTL